MDNFINKTEAKEYNVQMNEDFSKTANCIMDNNLEDVSSDMCNLKKQQTNKQLIFKSFIVTPSKTRDLLNTLRIGWLHKKDANKAYIKIKKPLGGIKRLKLNESQIYSAHEIKEMGIKEFTSSKNHTVIDKLTFKLGFSDGRIVDHFKRPDGKICDIWAYCEAYNISLYKLNLFLLSASIDGTDVDFLERTDKADKDLDLDVRFKKAKIKDDNEVLKNTPLIEDNISVFYHYIRTSKYSNEQSYTECTKVDLYAYILDDQSGVMPTVEEFDPLDYGCMISKLSKNERVFLQIYVNEDGSKSFVFPSSSVTTCHTIVHDTDEVQGIYDGKLGIGLVTSCNNDCRPTFTWYRDDEVFRQGEYLYWLSDILSDDDDKVHTWFCSVTCRGIKDELKSKVIQIS